MALVAVQAEVADVGERGVQRIFAEVVVAESPPQLHQQLVQVELAALGLSQRLGFLVGFGDHRRQTGHDDDLLGITAQGGGARLQVVVVLAGVVVAVDAGEGPLRDGGPEVAALAAVAGLEDHRLALPGAAEGEGGPATEKNSPL